MQEKLDEMCETQSDKLKKRPIIETSVVVASDSWASGRTI
jgi:hypothetical protein